MTPITINMRDLTITMRKNIFPLLIIVLIFFTQSCENNNAFSWATGSSSDVTAEKMLADGNKALQDKDYDKAKKLYDKILVTYPYNSEALYGKAAAELKSVDLDLSYIISALTDDKNYDNPIDSILDGLDMKKLADATDSAIKALKQITDGKADGTIPADDTDVNLNLSAIITFNAAADLLVKYNVNTLEDLDDINVSDADIDDTVDRLEDAKNYARIALGSEHEIVEIYDDLIETLEDLKTP